MDASWRAQRIERFDADREVAPIEDGLRARDPAAVAAAVDAALDYLERDPRGFRTGYAKQRLLARLRGQDLRRDQRQRVIALILRATRQGIHGPAREYGHLVRRFATNELRRELRRLMHSKDERIAWRATWLICHARRPGLDDADRAVAQWLLAERARSRQYVDFRTELIRQRLWPTS